MYQRNIVDETAELRSQPSWHALPVTGLRQLSDEDIDRGIHFVSDEPGMSVDPFAMFATRLNMANL